MVVCSIPVKPQRSTFEPNLVYHVHILAEEVE